MDIALVWLRRDLRLADNPALQAALDAGMCPLPVYIHAPEEAGEWAPGAASRAWLQRSLLALDSDLQRRGSRLIRRSGPSLDALRTLVAQTGARAVFWNRCYEPQLRARDADIKQALREDGLQVQSFRAGLLFEPWEIETGQGTPYKVFTPFWRNARARLGEPRAVAAPAGLPAPPPDLQSDVLDRWDLAANPAWDVGFWEQWEPGEAGAWSMLDAFIEGAVAGYREQRDLPDRAGTSRLSPHLHFGEISPAQIVERLQAQRWPAAVEADVEGFVRELGWREFSNHLMFHFEHSPGRDLNPQFAGFPWADVEAGRLAAWQQGRTGVPLVDAGMRELWHTGWMHNRVRMIVASFLTKNLRYHWLHGARWFWDTLVDADLANNTQGWQWTAGTGADAAPYFRVFNPATQSQRFDAGGRYLRQWLPELARMPDKSLHAPWEHADLKRRLAQDYPDPILDLKASREQALIAYRQSRSG